MPCSTKGEILRRKTHVGINLVDVLATAKNRKRIPRPGKGGFKRNCLFP